MSTVPRISKLAGTVAWDDGSAFDGYVLLTILFPADAVATDWTKLYKKGGTSTTPVRLPSWSVIPIYAGTYAQELGLFYNSDMTPHNTKYTATYYDKTMKEIAGPTASFTVSAATTTISAPTLPAPTAPA